MFFRRMAEDSKLRLFVLLWLIAVHSYIIAFALIFSSSELITNLGFKLINERFFPAQAGVFHIVMGVCYSLAAVKLEKFNGLIVLSINAKFIATVFLFSYYIIVDQILAVLLSGIVDCLMGSAIFLAYRSYRNHILGKNVK